MIMGGRMANFDQWWNNDESIQDNADTLKQRNYLIAQVHHIALSIDNEMLDMALMKIRQTMGVIKEWKNQ
jgi:hypothetical protein